MSGGYWRLKHSSLVGLYCGVFVLGIACVRMSEGSNFVLLVCLVSLALASFFFSNRLILMIFFALFLIGWQRGGVYISHLKSYSSFYDNKVMITATASEDAVYDSKKQLRFLAKNVFIQGEQLPGKIQVSGFGENAIFEGDRLLIKGKVRQGYGSSQATISYAQIELISRQPSLLSMARKKFATGISNSLPDPLSSFAMGILIGQRANLPEDVKQDLKHVGLTHIIAVSGYNLTIILRACEKFFAKSSKRTSVFASAFLALIFLIITGGAASIVRATIVCMLGLAAGYYGRRIKPLNIIMITAAVTAGFNPFYLWSDLGWWLSFLAFGGVLIVAPLLVKRLSSKQEVGLIRLILLETFCAEIMTLPLILHFFGELTLAGLLANLVVVSLIPITMLLSACAGVAGLILPSLCGWLSWPAKLFLNFILDLAHIIASLPNVFISNIDFKIYQMLALYAMLFIFIFVLHLKTKEFYSAKITDKNHNI